MVVKSFMAMINLAICVCTYKRNEGLKKLLDSIHLQEIDEGINLTIVVVDNANPPTTGQLIKDYSEKIPHTVKWGFEQQQGISYARNKTVQLAGNVDLCFFVDDDQVLDKNCLNELLATKNKYQANLVYGSNPPIFENENVPAYIKSYFKPTPDKSGDILEFAPTNCLLIEKHWLDSIDIPFDPRFAHTGGEDTYLTRQLVRMGAKLIKSQEAKAYELVPFSRCKITWILNRVFRESAIFSYQNVLLKTGILQNLQRLLKLSVKFITGLLIFIPILFFAKRNRIKGLMLVADSIGGLIGFFSYKKRAYL